MKIYIINPDTKKPVTIDDWSKDENPTRAQLLAIETEDGHLLIMSKSYLPGEYTFEDAQKACAAFKPIDGITFRRPSRKECIDIYDARFQGLDDAIDLTGGDYAKRGRYHWTGDRDTDPNYANGAWCSISNGGFLVNSVSRSPLALPVAVINAKVNTTPTPNYSEQCNKTREEILIKIKERISALSHNASQMCEEYEGYRLACMDVSDILDEFAKNIDALSPRHSWKPSEEQIKHLERCFSHGHTSQLPNQYILKSLYQDLQKLL